MEEKRYCAECRRFETAEDASVCSLCGAQLQTAAASDPVFLVTADPDSFAPLSAALDEAGVSYEAKELPPPPDGSVYSGRGLLRSKDVYVSAADFKNAETILETVFKNRQEEEEMPIKKRIFVQIISVFLFIAVIAGVVFAADWIAALVKNLFV